MELLIQSLSKKYPRGTQALDQVDLQIGNGMFGLLGPNGAGKTTLMKILATLLPPTSGQVVCNGYTLDHDAQQIRSLLGYLPQKFGFYPSLTAWETLDYMASLHNLPKGDDHNRLILNLLDQVNLLDSKDKRVGGFSGGMTQRLGIAQVLLNNPRLVIVDEPTAGLDPAERVRFRNLLGELSGDRIVVLSTHIVGDISSICDDMALLDAGKIQFRGSPAEIIQKANGKVWRTLLPSGQVRQAQERLRVISSVRRENGVELRIIGNGSELQELPQLTPENPTLEDAYLLWLESHDYLRGAHND